MKQIGAYLGNAYEHKTFVATDVVLQKKYLLVRYSVGF
jgi:hypothetical protein